VLSRNPLAVHVLGDEATPEYERAVVEWLSRQRGEVAA
jgi:hypothetical protein